MKVGDHVLVDARVTSVSEDGKSFTITLNQPEETEAHKTSPSPTIREADEIDAMICAYENCEDGEPGKHSCIYGDHLRGAMLRSLTVYRESQELVPWCEAAVNAARKELANPTGGCTSTFHGAPTVEKMRAALDAATDMQLDVERGLISPTLQRFRDQMSGLSTVDGCSGCERLQRECSEAYQVVGALSLAHGDMFETDQVMRVLDNLAAAAHGHHRVHKEVLPFVLDTNADYKRAMVLREGFERGVQWAVIDMARNRGRLSTIGDDGKPFELSQAIIADLFVPKPEAP